MLRSKEHDEFKKEDLLAMEGEVRKEIKQKTEDIVKYN